MSRTNVILRDEIGSTISNFETLAADCVLVDKTQAILDFLSMPRPVHLILRPRRSGKTVTLTMLQYVVFTEFD